MPAEAPIAKVGGAAGARRDGACSAGAAVDDCVARPASARPRPGMAFVHPFDDPDVVAGQGTLGLELLEDVPDLAKVVVPIGGGGLASGVAIAVKSARPDVEIVGVQAETVAPFPASLQAGHPIDAARPSRSPTASR